MTNIKAERAVGRAHGRRAGRKGFTLTEIMLSLGIMCIGLVMVAAAFHAGIQRHDDTVDDIVRTLVGENALAVAKARLRHSASSSSPYFIPDTDTFLTGSSSSTTGRILIGSYDLMYPIRVARGRGYVIMGRRLLESGDKTNLQRNEYEFRVLPYVCDDPNHHVEVTASGKTWMFNINSGTGKHQIVGTKTGEVQAAFPVGTEVMALVPNAGLSSAAITGYSGRNGLLDKKFEGASAFNSAIISMSLRDINGAKVTGGFEVAKADDAFVVRTALTPAQE